MILGKGRGEGRTIHKDFQKQDIIMQNSHYRSHSVPSGSGGGIERFNPANLSL